VLVEECSGRGALGAVSYSGHLLKFHSPTVDQVPDNIVQARIAHELAHCLHGAHGDLSALDELQREEDAEEIMRTWGFDGREIDAWLESKQKSPKVISMHR
jgi:hypothetical protein